MRLLKHKSHVMIEGISQSGKYGFLDIVKQEEVRGDANLRNIIDIIKVAELIVEGIDKIIIAI